MKHSVSNHAKMFGTVEASLTSNSALWNTIAAMLSVVTALKGTIASIFAIGQLQDQTSKGITIDKKVLRENLTLKLMIVIGGLKAFAQATGNMELYTLVNIGEGKLRQMGAVQFITKVHNIIDLANANIADLPDYNVPVTTVTAVTIDAAAFVVIMPKTRETITIVKNATAQLDALVKKGMIQIGVIKDFMLTFKISNPDFYAAVINASKIIDTGVRHNRFTGKVEKNGVAVPNAVLKVVEDNKETVATWNGDFEMEGIHTGKFTLIVSDGVTEKTIHDLTMRRGTDLNMVINMAA